MKSVITFWIYSAEQYTHRTPLNEITEHAQLNGFNDEPVDVLCLHGFQFIPAADIALMRERNFILQDVSPLFQKIANRYPNLRQRYTNHFFECFLRWLVIKEFYQGTPVLAWDADIFFNEKLSRLHAEFAGSTFTSSSTCFVALHDPRWLDVYEEQLNLFEQNAQSFLFGAFMRLNKLQIAGHNFKTSFFGPKTEASLNSVEIWNQTFEWSPEEMFVDYLVRSEQLPYHLAKGSSRYLLCSQPLLLPQLAWTHPLGKGFDTVVPDGSVLTKKNGCYQVGSRPLAFLHFQGAVFRACAAHQILHNILREPQSLHDEYCLPGRRAGIEVGTLFNGHRSAMIDRLNRKIGQEKLRHQWGDPYSERDVARNYLIKSDILDVLRNYGQFQAQTGSNDDRQSEAAAKLFGSSPTAKTQKELSMDNLENFLRRGQEMIAAGNIAAAIDQLVQAAELSPCDADLLTTIGQLHATQSNKDAARHFYSRALVINPNHSQAKEWLLELTIGKADKPVSVNGKNGSYIVKLPAVKQKICLATNYLLMTETNRQMWEDFSTQLKEQGCQLVLLSTLLPENPFSFPVFQIPYYMRNFAEWFPKLVFTGDTHVSAKEVELLRADMSRIANEYPLSEAVAGLTAYRAFANEVLQALQPAFVFIADNMLCQTAVLQHLCWDANIPVHIYERGLLPETLMIESRGVQSLSDLRTNWLANDIPVTAHDTVSYDRIRNYYLAKKPHKYVQPEFAGGGQDLRKQLNLDGKKIVLFLGGGFEANGHAPKDSNQARAFFPIFRSTEEALMGLWKVVEKMPNTVLVFKPHPLDHEMYAVAKIEGVKVVTDVNVHALIEAADVVAVQFTTLQFETVFYEKPILLLGRSVWWGRNATYEVESAEQLPAVLNDALARKNWPAIQANAHAFDVWMMEHFLIGCTPAVPARQNLSDLARFIARAGLDSHGLASVDVRWEKFQSSISQVRSGTAPVAPKPVASAPAIAPAEMTPDDPAKPNPLNGQPLLEPVAWQEMLEQAHADVAAGGLPKAFKIYGQIISASGVLSAEQQTALANDLAGLLPLCLKTTDAEQTDGLVKGLRLHPALARQLVQAVEKSPSGDAVGDALTLGTAYSAANRHGDAFAAFKRAKASGKISPKLEPAVVQWIEVQSTSVQARSAGGWASLKPTPYPLAADGRPKISPVWLEVTSFCNQSCSFCPDPKRKTKRQYMTLDIAKRCIDELKRDFHVDYLQLNAYGEPLLHPQFEQILTYLRDGNSPAPFFFTTHGMTLNERNVAMLDRAHPNGICVSLQNDGEASYAASRDLRIGNYAKLAGQVRNLVERFVTNRRACHVRLYQLLSNGKQGFGVPEEVLAAFPKDWERFAASVRTWEDAFRPLADNKNVWAIRNTDDQIREAFEQADHPAWWVKLDLLRWKDERGGEQTVFISPRPIGTYANTLPHHTPGWKVNQQTFNPGSCWFTRNQGLAIFSNGNLGICCLSVDQNAAFGRLQDFGNLKEAVSSEGCHRMYAELANGVARSDDCRVCLGSVEKTTACCSTEGSCCSKPKAATTAAGVSLIEAPALALNS